MAKLVIGTDKNNTGTASLVRDVSPECYAKFNVSNNEITSWNNFIIPENTIINISYFLYNGTNPPANFFGPDMETFDALKNVSDIRGAYVLYWFIGTSYKRNTKLKTVDLSGLVSICGNDSGIHILEYGFAYCDSLVNIKLDKLQKIGGGTNSNNCYYTFKNCTSLKSVNLSSLKEITGSDVCYGMFYECTALETVDLSGLTTISGYNAPFCNVFEKCSKLISVDLSSLQTIYKGNNMNYACCSLFKSCTSLPSMIFPSLEKIGGTNVLKEAFSGCTSLQSISFPALKEVYPISYTAQFNNMLSGCTGVTVHFPSNMQAVIGSWSSIINGFGGTNTQVLYDLPATNLLTGADTNVYSRNPKYDTVSALAWKVGDYGTTDFTPYYTSTTSDPVVGDTIYSDASCTTAVTTISSIA